jgi:hypothetical protein
MLLLLPVVVLLLLLPLLLLPLLPLLLFLFFVLCVLWICMSHVHVRVTNDPEKVWNTSVEQNLGKKMFEATIYNILH